MAGLPAFQNIYGPYEHKVVIQDDSSYPTNGLHQGGMVQLKTETGGLSSCKTVVLLAVYLICFL